MTGPTARSRPTRRRTLSDAIREVKNAAADRADVVVELHEAARMRLQLLAAELAPVFAEVPSDIDSFDFTVSSGLPAEALDRRGQPCRDGARPSHPALCQRTPATVEIVLAESAKLDIVAGQVTRYVAERIVEREQVMVGNESTGEQRAAAAQSSRRPRRKGRAKVAEYRMNFLSGAWAFITGVGFGLAIAIALLW